eukprot:TRINITY_DN7023_c0_g1_i1.p1 TRINITY_DN7023_c0_g1~~TRINITY_DN7023_c0_g1_i1.p1  ORF type:complete len:138 (-),score=33.66 TRINITY_DN7023_c0_g1_i1:64-477(-)
MNTTDQEKRDLVIYHFQEHIGELAKPTEEELFRLYNGITRDYKIKYRSILYNLKANQKLRNAVVDGTVSPQRLASMTTEQMATEELQIERMLMKANSLENCKDEDGDFVENTRYVMGQWVPVQEAPNVFENPSVPRI